MSLNPPPGIPHWGGGYRDFFAKYFARHAVLQSETENLAYPDHVIDLDPDVRDAWGLPAPRVTYDWRRKNEWKNSATPWERPTSGAPRSAPAHRARTIRAAPAWATIPTLRR